MAIVDGKIRCPTCGESKPLDAFSASTVRKRSGKCRPCGSAHGRAWALSNPERARAAYARSYARKSPEVRRAQHDAARARAKANGARMGYLLKSKYGIGTADYHRMLATQGGTCGICARPPAAGKRLFVDHDHNTGVVRGLLCQRCNSGLGMFEDDAQRMSNAIQYLEGRKQCLSLSAAAV